MELSKLSIGASIYGTNAVGDQVASAARKPLERLAQQADSTKVQLSAFGQVKSATAQVETAARKLADSKGLGTAAEATKAAQGFAEAYNAQLKAAKEAAATTGSTRPASDLRRAAEGADLANRDALRQVGVTFNQDGSLKVDAKALEKAYQANPDQVTSALKGVGKDVAEASARQLGNNGSVGSAISRLAEKLGNIQEQQIEYEARVEQSRKALEEQDRRANLERAVGSQQAFGFNGISAYDRIFSS